MKEKDDESWNDLVKSIERKKPYDANQLHMIKHFGLLRDELKREYFWCKVKPKCLHSSELFVLYYVICNTLRST